MVASAARRMDSSNRRLAAILFTDMRGYSRQMGEDEARTLERLREHNRILTAHFERHAGRVIKTVGDAFMVEFPSALAAVACALEVQAALSRRNTAVRPEDTIEVRIGIHVGDVVVEGGDLFGEAVNLAARLEPKAPPGEVCVSESVMAQVRRKVRARASDLGFVALKNIPQPVRLYALAPAESVLDLETAEHRSVRVAPTRPARRVVFVAAAGFALAGAVATALWTQRALEAHRGAERSSVSAPFRPVSGGTLRVGQPWERGRLDPFGALQPTLSRRALRLATERLAVLGSGGELVPLTLERWELRGDRRMALFLRKDLVFHDHPCLPGGVGRLATHEDLVYSLELAARHSPRPLPLLGAAERRDGKDGTLEGIAVGEAGEVEVTLVRPMPYPDEFLTDVVLLPRELAGCRAEDVRSLRQPVGTGPFRFTGPPEGESLELVRFDRYRGYDGGVPPPWVLAVRLVYQPDQISGISAVREGELDLLMLAEAPDALDSSTANRSVLGDAGFRVAPLHEPDLAFFVGLFVGQPPRPPLDDIAVRQAVALAIDRARVLEGGPWPVRAAGRFLAPEFLGNVPDFEELGYEPEQARRRVHQAKGAAELPIRLVVPHPKLRGVAERIVADLKRVGLRASVVETSSTAAVEAMERGEADLLLMAIKTAVRGTDPFTYVGKLVAFLRESRYRGARVLELGERISSERSRDLRAALYAELERALRDDLPVIPLGCYDHDRPVDYFLVAPWVRGVVDEVTGRMPSDFREVAMQAWLDSTEGVAPR